MTLEHGGHVGGRHVGLLRALRPAALHDGAARRAELMARRRDHRDQREDDGGPDAGQGAYGDGGA